MIPAFVISLPSNSDRRQTIAERLRKIGVTFEFVDGIDGRSGLDRKYEVEIDRQKAKDLNWPLTDAEFACALSHIKVYKKVVELNIPYALILEDDAIPKPELTTFLESKYFKGADLIQVQYFKTYVRPSSESHIFGHYNSYKKITKAGGASGYIISNQAAKQIIENAVPVYSAADWPNITNHLNIRLIYPPLVRHSTKHEAASVIGERVSPRRRKFLGVSFTVVPFSRFWLMLTAKRIPKSRDLNF